MKIQFVQIRFYHSEEIAGLDAAGVDAEFDEAEGGIGPAPGTD